MIDVMKRLAELDSTNPTIVKENQEIEECGMMPMPGMGGMERPSTPASINMTAGSGEELSDMLATIMQLAGVKQHGVEEPMSAEPMGAEPIVALTAEPEMGGHDDTMDMRSIIDKLNPMDDGQDGVSAEHGDVDNDGDHDMDDHEEEEETDEGQYDNSPADPTKPPPFKANQFAHQENQPGQGDRMDGNMPKATMEQQLMSDYKKFISEEMDQSQDIDQFVNGNRPNFNGPDEDDYDKARQTFVNFVKNKGINVDNINDDAFPVIVAMCQGKMCAWYDLETASGYIAKNHVSESKPSAGMSKGEKSSLVKKAKSGKDIGKPGKSFDKVAKAAGGGEKGKKIAAAAMWKNAAK